MKPFGPLSATPAIVLFLLSGPAFGQESHANRDPQVMERLTDVVTAAAVITPTGARVDTAANQARGGNNSGKPLGCYFCPQSRTFTSDYTHESAGSIASWSYDLHRFLSGGGRAYDLDHLPPYKAVRSFASDWWTKSSPAFAHVTSLHQSAWIYESILDGVEVWQRYQLLDGTLSSDGVMYFDAVLATYENASPSDIFF